MTGDGDQENQSQWVSCGMMWGRAFQSVYVRDSLQGKYELNVFEDQEESCGGGTGLGHELR